MAFSLKKRVQSKSRIVSNENDDSKVLGEVLHRSTKTKCKKSKKQKSLLDISPSLSKINPIIIYQKQCPCEIHYDKQLMEHTYQLTVDNLFDLMFGTNEFVRTYRQAQRFYDETATEWLLNESINHRERTLKYKVPYESTFIGKGTIFTREKQTLILEVPGSHYTLETEVYNEGVKFSDTFSLIIRYCLVQTAITTTNLRVTAQILYHKSVNGFIKQIIERNAYSASQEGLKDLNNRLNLIANFKMDKRGSSKNEITNNVPTTDMSQNEFLPLQQSLTNNNNNTFIQSFDSDRSMYILIFSIIILFVIHIYLYLKLKQTDFLVEKLAQLLNI